MEIKSVNDCLNLIDSMILCILKKQGVNGFLEDVRDYIIWMYNDKYIKEMLIVLAILSQINLIIENFFLKNECAFNPLYHDLRKHILAWLKESNTEPEVDNHQ